MSDKGAGFINVISVKGKLHPSPHVAILPATVLLFDESEGANRYKPKRKEL